MDTSFDLLSSMSPKIKIPPKPSRKPPTVLALKKYFRRSSVFDEKNYQAQNQTIVTITSSVSSSTSSCGTEDNRKKLNESPIVISDSGSETYPSPVTKSRISHTHRKRESKAKQLSQEKFDNIENWISDVNDAQQNITQFTDVSTIYNDKGNPAFKAPTTKIAASSTFIDFNPRRFNELFKSKDKLDIIAAKSLNGSCDEDVIQDSLINENKDCLESTDKKISDESFSSINNQSLTTRIKENKSNGALEIPTNNHDLENSNELHENVLDSLYGSSWRNNKHHILPSTEPRPQKHTTLFHVAPNTERYKKVIDIKDRGRARPKSKKTVDTPGSRALKDICDSDSSSQASLKPIKLNFEGDDDGTDSTDQDGSDFSGENKKSNIKKNTRPKRNIPETVKIATQPETYSFLASLSGNVPISKCDPSARIFRNCYKIYKEKLTAKLFKLYNENIFDNSIPSDTLIEWNERMRGTAGFCYCKKITRRTGAVERAARIVLSTKVLDSADRLRDTLLHEMCHAATWIVNQVADGHGSYWKAWADRAIATYPELPPIKRCHQYVINTKYTYRCINCGYRIGRHTKSLDVEKKRCGYCYGKFEVLLNKTNKNGETKTVPVTPKKQVSGFALFVKENYAIYKSPSMKHGDVMKVLGQKFSYMKVDQS